MAKLYAAPAFRPGAWPIYNLSVYRAAKYSKPIRECIEQMRAILTPYTQIPFWGDLHAMKDPASFIDRLFHIAITLAVNGDSSSAWANDARLLQLIINAMKDTALQTMIAPTMTELRRKTDKTSSPFTRFI